ncbi:polysaccharide pyruvyl transferase family protein [Psychromonas sp. MME2]|uniref:polysaccharide pyruvyl transferase family protein n=1 Tax=Psychromonas sp. MME2 TaxID=3231033 RepID=UPI00339C8FE2
MENIYVKWFQRKSKLSLLGILPKNFGDDLNPVIVEAIAKKRAVRLDKLPKKIIKPCHLVIGSILHWADENTIVWGPGFAEKGSKVISKPIGIKAVRGPLTRNELLKSGVDCPEVYGDPALLYSRLFSVSSKKRYKLGIIAHYAEAKNSFFKEWLKMQVRHADDIKVISVADSVAKVIESINECDCIASSSLHGIIIADSYNIPNVHVNFNGFVPHTQFKFYDYYQSVKKRYSGPFIIERTTTISDIIQQVNGDDIKINLDLLMENCPFRAS